MKNPDNHIIIFKTEDEKISVNVRFGEETAWLTLDQMASLFERDKSTISRHIKNVFDDGEIVEAATVANFATTAQYTVTTKTLLEKDLTQRRKGAEDAEKKKGFRETLIN